MSKGNTFENDLLQLIFNGAGIANLADDAGTAPLTDLYIALHTADPGEAGTQDTNECAYTSYVRRDVARDGTGFTVFGNQVSLAADLTFPEATGGSETATHWSVGVAVSGATKILYKGPLGSAMGPFTAKADDTITIPGHTFAVNDRIAFYPVGASSLPTGITEGTVYFVKTVSGDDITISTTQGGTVVDISTVGDGTSWKITPVVISNGVTPILTTGTTITED